MRLKKSEVIVLEDDESDDELQIVDARCNFHSTQRIVTQISKPITASFDSSLRLHSHGSGTKKGLNSSCTCQAQRACQSDVSECYVGEQAKNPSTERVACIHRSSSTSNTEHACLATDAQFLLCATSPAQYGPSTQPLSEAQEMFPPSATIEGDRRDRADINCHSHTSPSKTPARRALMMDLTQEDDSIEVNQLCFGPQPAFPPNNMITVLDEEEDEDIILLDDDEIMFEGALAEEELHRPIGRSFGNGTTLPQRNPNIALPWVSVTSCKASSGEIIVKGQTVEVKDRTFLIVAGIYYNNSTADFKIRGHSLKRTKDMSGMFNADDNELYWKVEVELDDTRPNLEQSMVEIDIREVSHCRRLCVTNRGFPVGRDQAFSRAPLSSIETARVLKYGILVVRWIYTLTYRDVKTHNEKRTVESAITRIKHVDAAGLSPTSLLVDDTVLRSAWRGETILHGSQRVKNQSNTFGLLNTHQHSMKQRRRSPSIVELYPPDPSVRRQKNYSHLHGDVVDLTADECNEDDTWPSLGSCSIQHHLCALSLNKNVASMDVSMKHLSNKVCCTEKSPNMREPKPQPKRYIRASSSNTGSSATGPGRCLFPLSQQSSPASSSSSSFRIDTGRRQYTFGDAFCGAGGSSRGACQAGLKLLWGLDRCNHAAHTWSSNFPRATLFHQAADELIISIDRLQDFRGSPEHKVDVLHLSPPCQYFSPAHTVVGKDDENNQAVLFACGDLIDIARPRLVTLEQTFGLTHQAHKYFLHHIINTFVSRGFSFRWSTIPLQYYGLPQRRLRLIFIAACPGEVLPEFPPYTHNEYGSDGKKPFSSVSRTLRSIPLGAANHNLGHAKLRDRPPWNAHGIVPRCITTHGGHNYHPSGKRDLTHREFAALQTFAHEHEFHGSFIKRQIGNAVPPMIAEILFRHITKALTEADDIEEREKARDADPDVMILD